VRAAPRTASRSGAALPEDRLMDVIELLRE